MARVTRFPLENHVYHTISATKGRRPIFTDPALAAVVISACGFLQEAKKAFVLAYALMPDHLHLVICPPSNSTLSQAMQSLKGYSSREINRIKGTNGSVWQQGFYDRVIRDEQHLRQAVLYVESNPVTAGLAARPNEYPFSSAFPGTETDIEAWWDDDRGWEASATLEDARSATGRPDALYTPPRDA